MLIGYVLVMVLTTGNIEYVNDQVTPWEECQKSLFMEKLENPGIDYQCAEVVRP